MESHEKVISDIVIRGEKMQDVDLEDPKKTTSECKIKDFDDLLPYLGEFGWYQRMLFLLMIPFSFFFAFVYFAQIFMTLVPEDYWCNVDELMMLDVDQRKNLAIPRIGDRFDKCHFYDVNWTDMLAIGTNIANSSWPKKKCLSWEFNQSDVPYDTIATQLGWVCEYDGYPATAQAIFFCGAIVGGLIFGRIADKYGRIPALMGTNITAFLAGIGTAYTNSFWSFCLCRFLVGLSYDNCFMVMYILVIEFVGPKWRTFVANMSIAVFFTFAACLLPWIALGASDWRIYTLITSAPMALAVFTPWIVPESVRWLIAQGRIEESLVILKRIEKINGNKVPDHVIKEFKDTATKIAKENEQNKSFTTLDLFKTPRLRKTSLLLFIIWMITAMVFDGHVRNVGSLGLDMFVTFTVATATELPADILLTLILDIVGRRWLSFGSMSISGIFCFLATAVPIGVPSATLALIGRFAVNISYNVGMQYAAELLPTVLRGQGLASIHIMGYVATIVVPYIVYLASISPSIPLLILGALGIIGGCLCLLLPESTGRVMPETMQDGENYGAGQGFWHVPGFKRKGETAEKKNGEAN